MFFLNHKFQLVIITNTDRYERFLFIAGIEYYIDQQYFPYINVTKCSKKQWDRINPYIYKNFTRSRMDKNKYIEKVYLWQEFNKKYK